MNKITCYLYMKVFEEIKKTNYDFHHTLFHLYRYLSINQLIKWERLFSYRNNIVKDDDFEKTFRLLLHHHFVDLDKNITEVGFEWLNENEHCFSELNVYVNAFFKQYNGEFAYEKSCFIDVSNFTFGCHLCKNHSCLKNTNLLNLFFSDHSFKIKNPNRSFSQ